MTASANGKLSLIFFGVFCLAYAVIAFTFLRSFGMRGNWYGAAAAVLFASPIIIGVVDSVLQNRGPSQVFDLNKASWAFAFGDTLALPLTAGASALVWANIDESSWWRTGYWTGISLTIGIGFSVWWRFQESRVYPEALFYSPTKMIHDLATYPVLFSGIILLVVPAIAQGWTLGPIFGSVLAIVGIAAWIALSVRDADVKLPPSNLHVAWDWSSWSVVQPAPAPS